MMPCQYVFIESRDQFDPMDGGFVANTASALRERGCAVTVFLVQNAVLATRQYAYGSRVGQLAAKGVTVLADDFSLRERGIEPSELAAGVQPAPIGQLVDLMVQPDAKTLWH